MGPIVGFRTALVASQAEVVPAGLLRREREPIKVRPQAMLEARDLPRCEISDFLQNRIDKALEADLVLRAKERGCSPQQVWYCMLTTIIIPIITTNNK